LNSQGSQPVKKSAGKGQDCKTRISKQEYDDLKLQQERPLLPVALNSTVLKSVDS
jgi:hypothetical protein